MAVALATVVGAVYARDIVTSAVAPLFPAAETAAAPIPPVADRSKPAH
jgi:hypothetical protein